MFDLIPKEGENINKKWRSNYNIKEDNIKKK